LRRIGDGGRTCLLRYHVKIRRCEVSQQEGKYSSAATPSFKQPQHLLAKNFKIKSTSAVVQNVIETRDKVEETDVDQETANALLWVSKQQHDTEDILDSSSTTQLLT